MENYYQNEISKLKDQIYSMQKKLDMIIKDNTDKVHKQVKSILDGFGFVPKKIFEQYPMLEIAGFAENYQLSQSYTHFCILFYSIISKIYKFLRGFLTLPSTTFLKDITRSFFYDFGKIFKNLRIFSMLFH